MTIHLRILLALIRLLTGFAFASLDVRDGELGLEPLLEGGAFTGDLKDIEGLPFVVFCVSLGALNRLSHHSEEEVDYRAHIAMCEGRPAVYAELRHRLIGYIGGRRKGGGAALLIE